MITRLSKSKVAGESPKFLKRIQGDICGPIHQLCISFIYFIVLIDASTTWSHVSLLSIKNRLLARIIMLMAQFSNYPIKTIHLDNTRKFMSKSFYDCCMEVRI